ncbi:SRPBCC family protein [Streptomyces oceani]|uniref:Carbon monoxide dehydrogenase n=1 Tax=Streptomyces oceani TaxID=1075402 RepID=A0A1E7KK79_9ACTN|nr:SRPBCC family protein [Streptomyces oceani]OEV04290.1 carbon monoxide dehydrogenase [Streptomyces oceani]
MQLSNTVTVSAPPDEVFALVNDVERVVTCMPGAALEGGEGDTWRGRVKVKVGPITAAYSGTVQFLEVDSAQRRLRLQARGADTHGSGDAEAEVSLVVTEAPEGARLELSTDLVIRGKIAQFGKGAIGSVSDKILQQFARNLGGLLDHDRATTAGGPSGTATDGATAPAPAAGGATHSGAPAAAPKAGAPVGFTPETELNGLSVLGGPALGKYGPVAAAFAFGLFQGWLWGRLVTGEKHLRAVRRNQ